MNDTPDPPETVEISYLCPVCGAIENVTVMQSKDPARMTVPGTQYRIPCYTCQDLEQRQVDTLFPNWRDDE